MGSETPLLPLCLPVIDFSNEYLKPGEPEWDLTSADVQKALQDYGCFEASFDRIPIELRKLVFETLEELFDLPLQTKLRNVSKKPFHGYVGQYPMVPLYESMGIEDPDVAERVNAFTKPLWPQGNNSFSTRIHTFSKKLSDLDITIRRMIMESFGLDKYIDEHLHSTNYLLRVMKYKEPDTEETKLGLNAHTDKNIVTILYQNHVEGLEVQTKDNNWIKVKPSKDSFIVMIGDSLHAMLNGRLHSPNHRVMMTGTETRYSLGLFSIPKAGHIISSPEELVDEEHPRLFKPFDHVEFLQFYYTQAGQRSQSALKTYCGI
ncbi:PREDICTED: probable 2-oxoglutarate-dependent dioxygenase AOP1 isoform X2 [Camelina sativa]|uniref:Probable 2-oxoglutarate-dependent dioxygenase AOP1 isoform X2 n=1 Tax=Camelina sativa TaxID=90675 RepID=A0ABM0YHE0_CAMSA|nr:PREDICTED: probable 2-oxoglutarate-dependent dioxygenase AOP1 isoform X2 [Camelina sativa]